MNIVQHLAFSVLFGFGALVQAQEVPTEAPPASPVAETQEEVPAPQKSLLKTVATKDFNKPLYFDQLDNGVVLPPLEFEYEMSEDGRNLKVGNIEINEKNFFFDLLPLGKTHAELNHVLSSSESGKLALVMGWPDNLIPQGTLEMISRTGEVLWSYKFTEADRLAWVKQLGEWRKSLIEKGISSTKIGKKGIFGSQFAILDVESMNAPFWGQEESFRFCITQNEDRDSSKLCSQRYGARSKGRSVVMEKLRRDLLTPRILFQKEDAPFKNSVSVSLQEPSIFYAELSTGESYEFTTIPNKLELMDISDTKKPDVVRVVAGRFTAVQMAGSFIFMGEGAYNHWFEDIFGWTNYWLSRQRWGVSAKYFQSFNQLKVSAAGDTAPLTVLTVDLKYRFTPGLWGRDESVGAMLSYQDVGFGAAKAPMLGVGGFWARSMPKVFDDFFNLLPFMRYPKWVDMEFIYYASSMSSSVTLNAPMSLNFHGKVLWTERIFGEAGFGLKRYGFADSAANQKAELNSFYGTVGLGVNF